MELIRSEYDGKIIIMYHPEVKLNKDGEMDLIYDHDSYNAFIKSCKANNITFLDVGPAFENAYKSNYEVPYGFNNTNMGSGHLNASGHRIIAEQLYKELIGSEK